MAVRIRLKRMGTKKRPHSRIVVCNSKVARGGKHIEEIGFYDPSKNPPFVKIDKERATYWLSVGAKPSDTVKLMLKKEGMDTK